MIRIRDIAMDPAHDPGQLIFEAAKILRVSPSKIRKLTLVRRSVDARKKPDVRIVYTIDVAVDGSEKKILKSCGSKRASAVEQKRYLPPKTNVHVDQPPVVVGFGPCGMFAAYILALAGLKPIVLERGEDALTRSKKVEQFFASGVLDPESNVQFGEGGAGTFSDGKLNTGVNNVRIGWILEQFVAFGAHEDILYDAKPHVGTDVLVNVVQNLRKKIVSLGADVRFCSKVTKILTDDQGLCGLEVNGEQVVRCRHAIFAIGHSARDTFTMLYELGISMEPKPFSMGVRIEHSQAMIDKAQYGIDSLPLPPADYKLVRHLENSAVYTFCMCPGGYVVAAASELGGVVTNGMSNVDRAGENANSALLVTVEPSEFPYPGALGGMLWQRQIEQCAYQHTGGYLAPAQRLGDFLNGRKSEGAGDVRPTYRPGVFWTDLNQILPEKISSALKIAIPQMNEMLAGFSCPDAVLTGPETRSSSPVRILRDGSHLANVKGFYPAGEGAGYAGGIMSAAVDGILTAEAVITAMEEGQ